MPSSSQSPLQQEYSELERKLGLEQDKNIKIEAQCVTLRNEKEDLRQKVSVHI